MTGFLLQQDSGKINLESGTGSILLDEIVLGADIGVTVTNETKTFLSYLYFQYIDDQNLPALIDAYNVMTQSNVDWFNNLNLPIYTLLSGNLLDWVGAGLYGYPRPVFSSSRSFGSKGPIDTFPTDNLAIASTEQQVEETTTSIPDGIYKRILTWFFYKGDTRDFSIPWLKRRIARFLYGIDGQDANYAFTPAISVTFESFENDSPLCRIQLTDTPAIVTDYFVDFINIGISNLPFRFRYLAEVV